MKIPSPESNSLADQSNRRSFLARSFGLVASLFASRLYAQNSAPAPAAAPASTTASTTPAVAAATTAAAPAATTAPAKPPMPTIEEMGRRNVYVHDPSTIVKCKDTYYVYCTGAGISSRHSKDLINWENGPRVLAQAPDWVATAVPGNRGGNFWAPDIIHFKDKYLMYYAVSTTGRRTSAIALATNPTLDPADPAYLWTDQGVVIQTIDPRDNNGPGNNYNAIDPAIFADTDGKLWLCFGSFWQGIKLIELDPATGKRVAADSPITELATNNNSAHDVEASYIFKHGDYYYLFVNWGKCCAGVASTYKIMLGRSKVVTGPYLDKDGKDLAKGGGTLFLGSEEDFIGPGHAGIIEADGKFWFSCHFYDGSPGARPNGTLATRTLHWDADGWPAIEPKQNYVAENTRTAPARGNRGRAGAPPAAATPPAATTSPATPAAPAATTSPAPVPAAATATTPASTATTSTPIPIAPP